MGGRPRKSHSRVQPTPSQPLRACDRCRTRHTRCDGTPEDGLCRGCKQANAVCTGREQTVFRVFVGDPSRKERVSSETSIETTVASTPGGEDHLPTSSTPPQAACETTSPWSWVSPPTTPAVSLDSPSGSLNGVQEAQLFKHFISYLSPWFDYCDPQRNFHAYISSNASVNPTLLNAVLATSARHLSTRFPSYSRVADEYQHDCLETLIPALDGEHQGVDDMIFASALLLRFLEEMTEPPAENTCHLVSAQMLLKIRDGDVHSSPLTDAALIVALRQDIFVANMVQRPVGSLADRCNIDRSLSPTTEVMWAYRSIAHAAETTNFVYGGEEEDKSVQRWDALMQYTYDWESKRPSSFLPLYQSKVSPPTFPNSVFANDCHVAAHQHLLLCRILLLACDPRIPVLGLGRSRLIQDRDETIRHYVREICGTSMSNVEYVPARSIAGQVIGMCGELFADPEETKILWALLSDAESHLGWPFLKASDTLRSFWNLPGG